jgi:hypothetical protein
MMSASSGSSQYFLPDSSARSFPQGVAAHIHDLMLKEVPPKFGEEPCLTTATMRAVEDLEHYHELKADALRAQTFSEKEATILVDVCRGWLATTPWEAICLWHEVDDYLGISQVESGVVFDPAWERNFVERLQRLSALEAWAVVRAAQRFRSLPPDLDTFSALTAIGLITAESERATA